MIELEDVHFRMRHPKRLQQLLSGESGVIPPGHYILLGHDALARSALINLLSGIIMPGQGIVRLHGRPSWPIGRFSPMRADITGYQMIGFFSSLYSLDHNKARQFVLDFSSLSHVMEERITRWPRLDMVKLTFCLALLPRFDIYFVDGMAIHPDPRFQARWREAFERRTDNAMLIMSTGQLLAVRQFCDSAIVADHDRLFLTDDVEGAMAAYPPLFEEQATLVSDPDETEEDIV